MLRLWNAWTDSTVSNDLGIVGRRDGLDESNKFDELDGSNGLDEMDGLDSLAHGNFELRISPSRRPYQAHVFDTETLTKRNTNCHVKRPKT